MSTQKINIENWSKELGLFPMPLFDDKIMSEKFVLLNGGVRGNLCLDYTNDDITNVRNFAWSADLGHYLVIDNQDVNIFRWDSFKSEKYNRESVEKKLESFYNYLKKQENKRQDSIVKFGIHFLQNY